MDFRVIDKGSYGAESAKPTVTVDGSVITLNLGRRMTGGWSIDPVEVTGDATLVTVKTKINGPGAGSIVTQALTSPYVRIDVHVHPAAVRWLDQDGNLVAEAK
jgi:protease stability complex PrcB-like protein